MHLIIPKNRIKHIGHNINHLKRPLQKDHNIGPNHTNLHLILFFPLIPINNLDGILDMLAELAHDLEEGTSGLGLAGFVDQGVEYGL